MTLRNAGAEQPDTPYSLPKKSDVTIATADFFGNLANQEGSLRHESSRMVEAALNELAAVKRRPDTACSPDRLTVVFTSTPRKYLKDYSEFAVCESHRKKTSASPLVFPDRGFGSTSHFSTWLSHFSQGEGKLGKELYRRCPGKCSPQYTYFITTDEGMILVAPRVVCGHARDKSDNKYELQYEIRCGDSAAPASTEVAARDDANAPAQQLPAAE